MKKLNKCNQNGAAQIALNIVMILLCIAFVAPLLLVLTTSLTSDEDIIKYGYSFIPKHIDFSAYRYVLSNADALVRAYGVTFAFSTISMISSLLLMAMVAYPLSRNITPGRRFISMFLYFTMLFNGGLVPTYILITKYLHLGNNFLVYILPGMISPWYVFMMRTNFQGLPSAIVESAYLDGASEYTIFFKFILPLSKPVLATIALFVFLARWNDWYTCMLYIDDDNLTSLQYLLQKIVLEMQMLQNPDYASSAVTDIPGEAVRMALAVFVAGPALFVFPFFQKYFVKGMTVGSVKG